MKKINSVLMFITMMLFINSFKSQVVNYGFNQTTSTFTNVNTGTIVGTVIQDDDLNVVNLPFNFTFNNNQYNSIYINTNGFISFVLPGQISEYYPISNATQEIISAFGQDLFMGTVTMGEITAGSNTISNVANPSAIQVGDSIADWNFDFGGISPTVTAINGNNVVVNVNSTNTNSFFDLFLKNGSIKVNLIGTAPNRVFEINYRNMTRYTVYDEVINFKIRLHETSYLIEVIYGEILAGLGSYESEVGLKGNLANDFNSRWVNFANTWSTSSAAINIADNCIFNISKFPNSGLTYQWTSTTCVQPTLSAQSTNSIICAGSSATLFASGATSYSWSNGSTSNSIIVTPGTTQTYTITGYNGTCTNTLTISQQVSACTSVKENNNGLNIVNIYPNPFTDQLIISLNISGDDTSYELYDLTGKLLMSGKLNNSNTFTINTTELTKGIYFIKLKDNSETVTKRVIKSN